MASTQQLLLGEGAGGAEKNYIEDVFSTYLYTGTAAALTITNNIDLSTKGGMVWLKNRTNAYYNNLFDTARGVEKRLYSNTTDAQVTTSGSLTAFNTDGFSLGTASFGCNDSGNNIASWTFRKQPKFFDVVTWTGNGSASQTISHNLGSTPGCIITKRTDTTGEWWSYHTSLGNNKTIRLNSTAALTDAGADLWGVTSTTFTASSTVGANTSAGTYVAYIFAHDAGGFGLTGTDNVISCGSYTTVSNAATVNLGYEPQWVLSKRSDGITNWTLVDSMRGFTTIGQVDSILMPNKSDAEYTTNVLSPNATGFDSEQASGTYIYIAIRRGPMKVPTDGTKVFKSVAVTNTTGTVNTTGFPIDLSIFKERTNASGDVWAFDRLRGVSSTSTASGASLKTNATQAEGTTGLTLGFDNTGFKTVSSFGSVSMAYWNFQRAPSFFDEVCFTGTGSAVTVNHNLQAVPELMIVKSRSVAEQWLIYHSALGNTKFLYFTTGTPTTSSLGWNNTSPTSTQLTVGAGWSGSGVTLVAYLFATCAGVSKVGSYTGTGTTKQIDCGFAAGARFVLIKRTDSTGDWYIWDTARGIVSGNDPYLLLNSTAAEVTSTDYIDTYSAGFELSSTAPAALNASGGTYIFLAIA